MQQSMNYFTTDDVAISVDGISFKVVREVSHLGALITKGADVTDIKQRLDMLRLSRMWKNHNINTVTLMFLLNHHPFTPQLI